MLRMFLDYRFYLVAFLLIGKSPLSRFGVPIDIPYSAMVLLFILMLIFFILSRKRFFITKSSLLFMLVNILYLIFIFSIVNSQDVDYSFYNYFVPNLLIYLTLLILFLTIESYEDIQKILKYALYLSLLILFIGVVQVIVSGNIDRLSVLGGGPNTFYRFMIQSYILSLYFSFVNRKKILLMLSAVLSIILGLATGSKGALVTFIIVWTLQLFLLKSKSKLEKSNVLKKILILIIVVPIASYFEKIIDFMRYKFTGMERILTVFNYNELINTTSGIARLNILEVAFEMFITKPLFGWGPGGYYLVSGYFGYEHVYAHNIIFEIFSEYGIIAGVIFIVLITNILINFLLVRRKSLPVHIEKLINTLFLLFVTYLVSSMFSGNIVDARNIFVYAILLEHMYLIVKKSNDYLH